MGNAALACVPVHTGMGKWLRTLPSHPTLTPTPEPYLLAVFDERLEYVLGSGLFTPGPEQLGQLQLSAQTGGC